MRGISLAAVVGVGWMMEGLYGWHMAPRDHQRQAKRHRDASPDDTPIIVVDILELVNDTFYGPDCAPYYPDPYLVVCDKTDYTQPEVKVHGK